MNTTYSDQRVIEERIAAEYRGKGYEVVIEPKLENFPFDLGYYKPDLIARKEGATNYIIEIKRKSDSVAIEMYLEIADRVAQHLGWRFLVITGDDVDSINTLTDEPLSLVEIKQRLRSAQTLILKETDAAAFVLAWSALEALLRRISAKSNLPLDKLVVSSVINNLFSLGELSIQHFRAIKELQTTRNKVVHGFEVSILSDQTKLLLSTIEGILSEVDYLSE